MSLGAAATALAWGAAGSLLLLLRARRLATETSAGDKPVDHIVFFRLSAFPPKLEAGLRLLSNSVPGVIDVSVGPTFATARSWGYTHGIAVRLKSRRVLHSVYATHPQHARLPDYLSLYLTYLSLHRRSSDPCQWYRPT